MLRTLYEHKPDGMKIQSPGYNEAYVHGTLAILVNFFISMESGSRNEKPEPELGFCKIQKNRRN